MKKLFKKPTYPCVETIAVSHNEALHLAYHQERMDQTIRELWGEEPTLQLEELIQEAVKQGLGGLCKCRIVYQGNTLMELTMQPYELPSIRNLKRVYADDLAYTFKSCNREGITALKTTAPRFDDVLIIREGLVTDTSFCNVAFFDGYHWITPRNPLLKGVTRARLLTQGMLIERDIPASMIHEFKLIMLFNALNDFGSIMLSTEEIY